MERINRLLNTTRKLHPISKKGKDKNVAYIVRKTVQSLGLWKGCDFSEANWAWIPRTLFLILFLNQTITLILAKRQNDFAKLFECFSVLTFCFMGFLKMNSLRKFKKQWKEILSEVQALEGYELSNHSFDEEYDSEEEEDTTVSLAKKCINKYSSNVGLLDKFMIISYAFTVTLFIVSPFIELGYRKIMNLAIVEVHPLFLPGWIPIESLGLAGYTVILIWQIISSVYCVQVHVAFDVVTVSLMIFLSRQFKLLRDQSTKIAGKGDDCMLAVARDARAHVRIIQCHRLHIATVGILKRLDKLLRNILGVYYLIASLTLCSVAVRLITMEMSVMQYASVGQYTASTLVQLFFYCYFGDSVFNQSYVRMGEGPFATSYWCLSPRVRRELTLLAIGMTRQHRLNAGPFNTLDLPSFVMIIRMAYSYYALVRK